MNEGNNFYTGVAPDPNLAQGDVSSQMRMQQHQDAVARETSHLPDPMDKLNPLIADTFEKLVQIKSLVKQVSENPSVNQKELNIIQDKIDSINKELLDLPNYFAKISI